jgi:CPA1 family monovalent cation:H+ antiporter
MEYVHVKRKAKKQTPDVMGDVEAPTFGKHNLRNALILTLCGAKGTITLSILFTIPVFMATTGERFPERSLIIFLGCGVILCTLLLSTFLVPVIAPKPKRKLSEIQRRLDYYDALSDILRNVIESLTAMQNRDNQRAMRSVIKAYQDRLDSIRDDTSEEESDEALVLRLQTLEWEALRTRELVSQGIVRKSVGIDYLNRLDKIRALVLHRSEKMSLRRLLARFRVFVVHLRFKVQKRFPNSLRGSIAMEFVRLQQETFKFVISQLKQAVSDDGVQTEYASQLLLEYQTSLAALRNASPSVTTALESVDDADQIRRQAYQIELEEIQHAYEQDKITRADVRRMRENVFLMQMDLEDRF